MSDAARTAFEDELTAEPEKRELAKRLKAIDDALQDLNEAVLHEKIPDRLLDVVRVNTNQPKKNRS